MALAVQELALRGLLSFGPDSAPLELRRLNVLIGPNGSGKSNFLEALALLRAAPTKLAAPVRGTGGGVTEWLWKGAPAGPASVAAVLPYTPGAQPLRHRLRFAAADSRFELVAEDIADANRLAGESEPRMHYAYGDGRGPVVVAREAGREQRVELDDWSAEDSILAEWSDPVRCPELAHLKRVYTGFRLYRESPFGRMSLLRQPQRADMPSDRLEEDFSNLGLVLNRLRETPAVKRAITAQLRDLYDGLEDFDVRIKGGTVEVYLTEGDFTIPASRLSDGTLRYLCLLAILLDPDPPCLIGIEEPELGLHPDLLPRIADLLVAASERTQLVVTTHSDILVDALTEQPEAVVVVEKHVGQTHAERLSAAELATWLEEHRLGQLWTRGQIGGTRW